MTQILRLTLKKADGALLRVLGLVARRGFDVVRLEARATEAGDRYEVDLTVSGARPIDVLSRQLAKLFDVIRAA